MFRLCTKKYKVGQGGVHLTLTFSLYLDVLRFVAALAVFAAHLASPPFTGPTFLWRVGGYGEVAVAAFFVLSGYVIAYVSETRENTARKFIVSRVSRLYSMVLIALILTLVLDSIGAILRPMFYADTKVFMKSPSVEGYIASLLFVNEYRALDFGGIAPGSNGPFWSLSFEATYYAIAAAVLFLPWKIWAPFSAVLLAVAGHTVTALFPLWWVGYALYRARPVQLPRVVALALVAASSVGLALAPGLLKGVGADWLWQQFPYGRGMFPRNLLLDYAAAALIVINLLAARAVLSDGFRVPNAVQKLARWLGAQTFPLYCIHFPVLCFAAALSPFSNASVAQIVYLTAAVIVVTASTTPMADWLKDQIRQALVAPDRAKSAESA